MKFGANQRSSDSKTSLVRTFAGSARFFRHRPFPVPGGQSGRPDYPSTSRNGLVTPKQVWYSFFMWENVIPAISRPLSPFPVPGGQFGHTAGRRPAVGPDCPPTSQKGLVTPKQGPMTFFIREHVIPAISRPLRPFPVSAVNPARPIDRRTPKTDWWPRNRVQWCFLYAKTLSDAFPSLSFLFLSRRAIRPPRRMPSRKR